MRFFSLACWALCWATCGAGCQSASPPTTTMPAYQTERFYLHASPGCPEGYPAMLDEGRFITSDGGSFPVPWGSLLEGTWGGSTSAWAVGDDTQPAPDSLELRWFSFTEDKFYEGHFLLPQQRIHSLLKNGYLNLDTRERDTYTSFTVNVVPTGVVFVWLSSGSDEQVLIGRYQAREIPYDFQRFRPKADRQLALRETRASLPPAVRQQIAAGTISSRQWDAYLARYAWQLAFSQPLTLLDFGIGYVNAEAMASPALPDTAAYLPTLLQAGPKPVPQSLHLHLSAGYGRQRDLYFKAFDEAQTMHAFQTLHAAHPGEPLTLLLETDERVTKARLFVQNSHQRIELTKTPVEIYEAK